jgi:membrane associated rhomboid family serine protease
MANSQEGNLLLRIISYTASLVIDGLSLVNPQNVKSVFAEMRPLPTGFLRLYLFIIPIPLFIGYFLFFKQFQLIPLPLADSLKLAFMYYATAAILPAVMAYLLYLFDVRLVRARVPHNEALTLFTYALTPGILSGIFKTSAFTMLLHIIGMMYSIYLIYSALETRYGQERSVMISFIFLVLSGMFSALLLMVALKMVLGIPTYYW